MSRKASGAEKVSIIRETQDNGDIYVYERKTIYDPNKRYNRSTGKTLIGKIPKGHTEMINTRPKKRALSLSADQVADVGKASRRHIGMLDIIAHVAKKIRCYKAAAEGCP